MHIPKTCFPLRLMHDGSQGQHLVNRFKLHKDSSAVQWMQNQIGILHWAHTVKATEGQVIPSLHRCTFVRPPHESRHLPHYSVYSFLRPERKLTNLLFLILWIDPKMGQLTKLGGDLVCFQCLESGISCVKRLCGWHSSTAVTAMPTHTHIHVRIIIWLYIYMYYTSALSDPQRFNQKLQIHTWRTFCHTHITTSIYINVLGLSRHNSFMPYVGSSWLPRVMMRQSGSSMKKAKSNMKISQAFGPDTGGQITRFRLQSTLYKLTFHMELHLCICRCVYMLEKHTVYLFNYLFVYEFIKSRTQTHTHN